jgi:hypothetical protein
MELGKAMPVGHVKKNFENIGVVGLGKETIKNGYSTLVECVRLKPANANSTYLKHVLIITSSHLLQF